MKIPSSFGRHGVIGKDHVLGGKTCRRLSRVIRVIVALVFLLLLPVAALAQATGAGAPPPAGTSPPAEPLSRAQVVQMIANRGYFEMSGLKKLPDGSWRCTALAGIGKRVAVTMDRYGNITQTDLPPGSEQ
jgi:hypothetical protein